jgi:hypothetical protein
MHSTFLSHSPSSISLFYSSFLPFVLIAFLHSHLVLCPSHIRSFLIIHMYVFHPRGMLRFVDKFAGILVLVYSLRNLKIMYGVAVPSPGITAKLLCIIIPKIHCGI